MRFGKTLAAFALSVAFAYVLAAAAHTQFVLAGLTALGIDIPLAVRAQTTAHDILGMISMYGSSIAGGLLIGFLIAGLLARYLPSLRTFLYALAGGTAVFTALFLMKMSFQLMPIAGARSATGLAAQVLCGVAAGLLFTRLKPATRADAAAAGPG